MMEGFNLSDMFNLEGRVALVTGGTRGIGALIAKGLKANGAKVWIHGSREDSAREAAEAEGFEFVYGDLEDINVVDEMVKKIRLKETKLDILVNNAGYETHSSIEDADEKFLDKIYNINTKSPFFLVQKFLPMLKESGKASVINVTSIHDVVPVRENSSYCMSKASLAMFTKVAALELAKFNIRVNNLAPGAICTDHNRDLINEMDFDQWIPLERVGESEEIAGPAVFLASDAASYVTGTTLYVDGGYKENLLRY